MEALEGEGYLKYNAKITLWGLNPSGYLCSGGNDSFSNTIQLEDVTHDDNGAPAIFERCLHLFNFCSNLFVEYAPNKSLA